MIGEIKMNTQKKNILVVDDDVDYLSQLEFQLQSMGYGVQTANNEKDYVITYRGPGIHHDARDPSCCDSLWY